MSFCSQEEWDSYYNKVYGYFYRRLNTRSDVEDLVAETLYAFFQANAKEERPMAYLWSIARNKLTDYIKSKSKNPVSLEWEIQVYDNVDNTYSKHYEDKLNGLLECVKKQLSDQDKEIVELSIMLDFNSVQISQKINLTPVNIRKRLSRAIQKLKEKCKEVWITT